MRVLIVDDEEDVRLLLRLQLSKLGWEITGEAADGAAALSACKENPPDVVVLDLLMPGVNGFETIPMLQAERPGIGIVAYTAVAGTFVREEMARQRIPLVLKTATVTPLDTALRSVLPEETAP